MEEKKTWNEAMKELGEAMGKATKHNEYVNIGLGMAIQKLKQSHFYGKLVKFLNGDDSDNGSLYFAEMKPLYDEYGYEKVNKAVLHFYEAEQVVKGVENE